MGCIQKVNLKIYKVELQQNYSYETMYEEHFETLEKAKRYAMGKGFYRAQREYPNILMYSPFAGKVMLEVGNFLLDITKDWIKSDKYDDDVTWSLDADYAYIREIKVL